jgi:Lipopolysaccharide export system permease LptF/LptG
MSTHTQKPAALRLWRGLYGALLVLLPRTLRQRHGQDMLHLYERDLDRSAQRGPLTLHTAAVAGLGDLLRRGLVERVVEERRALERGEWFVLRKSAGAFLFAVFILTDLLVALSVRSRLEGMSGDQAISLILYSVPFNAALAIPMAIFIAVLWVGNRKTPTQPSNAPRDAAHRPTSLRLMPLVLFATAVAMLSYVVNAEVVPRANIKLQYLQVRGPVDTVQLPLSDRSMTMYELRSRSRRLEIESGVNATAARREALANLQVEIHKKFALAGACVALALLAAGIAKRAPRSGVLLHLIASVVVFTGYYTLLTVGETLADRMVMSPALAMWGANIVVVTLALATLWRRRHHELQSVPVAHT